MTPVQITDFQLPEMLVLAGVERRFLMPCIPSPPEYSALDNIQRGGHDNHLRVHTPCPMACKIGQMLLQILAVKINTELENFLNDRTILLHKTHKINHMSTMAPFGFLANK